LAERELSFEATVYSHQIPAITRLAADFPQTPIVLSHAGTPVAIAGPFGGLGTTEDGRNATDQAWRRNLQSLAEQPNVTVKISGLTMPVIGYGFHTRAVPDTTELAAALHPYVSFLIDTFGADRCMFASNFPIDKVSVSWITLFHAFDKLTSDRPADDREALFHRTASRVYRLTKQE